MSFAFGHLLGAWLLGKLVEITGRKKLSHGMWFFLLLGGILPDADFLLDWTLRTELHRTFTHSLLFVLVAPVLLYIFLALARNKDSALLAFSLASGIIVHLLLDMPFSVGVPLLWPNLLHFSYSGITYFNPAMPSFLHASVENLQHSLRRAVIDMGLGAAWILYLALRRRARF